MEDENFFKVYSQVPLNERKLVAVIIDNEPVSWNVAYEEIKNKTEIGEKILKILKELDII